MATNLKYANAYTEVYEILKRLNNEEYSKIPKDLISVFEEYRNVDYEYEVNTSEDLYKQPMLRETKAILLNIFKDYLATPEQRQKIDFWLVEDKQYLERKKKEEYKGVSIETFAKGSNKEIDEDKSLSVINKEQQSLFHRIFDKLKKVFKL